MGLTTSGDLSLLQLASLYEPELALRLIEQGCECDLHSACALGLADRIETISSSPALGETQDYLTPMGWAILKGQHGSVTTLLSLGDNPERPLERIGFFEWEMQALGSIDWYPIHAACTHGYHSTASSTVRSLVEAGAHIERISPLGSTPLGLACTYSWIEVIRVLLDLGANIDSRSEREPDLVWQLSAPGTAARSSGQTPLMIAAGEGQLDAARFLLEQGCDRDIRDSNGSNALHIAAGPWWQEKPKIVELLLEYGMDPSVLNTNHETPLQIAKRNGYRTTAKLLSSS